MPAAIFSLKKTVFFLLLCIPFNLLFGQKSALSFEHLSIEQGLSQSTVNCIFQDSRGFMWIGTADGLNRYDGYYFKVFRNDPRSDRSISDNGITAIFEDTEGNLWVGTALGNLNKFDRKKEEFSRFSPSLKSNYTYLKVDALTEYPLTFARFNDRSITSIIGDKKGRLWIGTWGSGLLSYSIKENKFFQYRNEPDNVNSISSNRVVSLYADKMGIFWAGTFGGGLNRIERIDPSNQGREELKIIRCMFMPDRPASISDNHVIAITGDNENNLWVGTFGGGLNKVLSSQLPMEINRAEDVRFIHYISDGQKNNALNSNKIMALLQDRQGNLWIGTFGGGLGRMDIKSETFTAYKSDPLDPASISDNDIISLFEDQSGIIWIGTHLGKGINRYDRSRNKFTHFMHNPSDPYSLSDNVVWTFAEDKDGFIWIGTYRGGLNKFDRKLHKFQAFLNDPLNNGSISSDHIRSLLIDQSNNIWIGTYNGGLNFFDRHSGKFIRYYHDPHKPSSLSNNQVLSLLEDKNGNIWVGTFGGGLDKIVRGTQQGNISFMHYRHSEKNEQSISDDRIYKICEDKNGMLWIGTFGGGLCVFNPSTGKFKTFSHNPEDKSSLSENRVISIHEDKYGNIWAGTFGGGLNKLDKVTGKFTKYFQEEGMHNNVIYGILEDKNNNLWISSDNGLAKLNILNEHFINYDLHDGLQSMEFSGGAYLKASNGEMFFGGINGFNSFFPENIRENSHIPPIVISAFRIFNREIGGEPKEIVLDYKDNFFSFEFSALDYTNSEQNRYAYKLIGLDKDWHFPDASRRFANYTNLDPGKYIFKVIGSNNDGVWNNQGVEVSIIILPPFWQRWWFILALVLFFGGSTTYFVYYRFKQLIAIERLKSKLAADLHDNIGSGLTEISILSEVIAKELCDAPENIKLQLTNIGETSGRLIDNMSDIVWVVNPKRDSLHDLLLRLKDSYAELFSSIGISFKVKNLESLKNQKLPMEYRQNLYLIFKEAINNSLKHANCKNISLEAKTDGKKIEITLKDDGRGFTGNTRTAGNGLNNMQKRAKKIGGILVFNSAAGQGTTISFSGNINRANIFHRKPV